MIEKFVAESDTDLLGFWFWHRYFAKITYFEKPNMSIEDKSNIPVIDLL